MNKKLEEKRLKLMQIRNKLLRFHKVLLDWERENYEREVGTVSAVRFLELLLGEPRFEWLRRISTLIVKVDEAFDLKDGLSQETVDTLSEEISNLFSQSKKHGDFKKKLKIALPQNLEASRLKYEIKEMLKEKNGMSKN